MLCSVHVTEQIFCFNMAPLHVYTLKHTVNLGVGCWTDALTTGV